MSDWVDTCLRISENPRAVLLPDQRVALLSKNLYNNRKGLLAKTWRAFPALIDEADGRPQRVIALLKLHSASKSAVISLGSLV